MEEIQNQSESLSTWAVSTGVDLLEKSLDYVASFSIGQYIFKNVDKILWIVEKTALWSVPYKKIATIHENGEDTPPVLIRPLPWILFFPILIALCLFRKTVSIFTVLTGIETRITAETIVKYIQSKRKYIRRVRFSGLTTMRARNRNVSTFKRICNACVNAICVQGYAYEESKDVRITNGIEESDSGEDVEEETIEAFLDKLTKFSEMSSADDSDYLPDDDSDSHEEEEEDSSECESPLKVIPLKGKHELNQRSNSITVISEENEDSEVEATKNENGIVMNGEKKPGSIKSIPEAIEEAEETDNPENPPKESQIHENGHSEEIEPVPNNTQESCAEADLLKPETPHQKSNGGEASASFIQNEQNSRPVENGEQLHY